MTAQRPGRPTRLLQLVWLAFLLGQCPHAHAAPRVGSYARQSSSGAPLVVAGRIDTAAVRYLARFDDVTLELTPWAQDVTGWPRSDVPAMLRAMNPNIRLWLYVLAGDQWLPPSFRPQPDDRSGFRDVFDAVNAGNGWLWARPDTAFDRNGGISVIHPGAQWFPNYRVNLADSATVSRLGGIYTRLVGVLRPDGIFLDDAHTSIAWTSKPERPLDVQRAGFRSLAAMDSARQVNVERLIARLHEAGGPCLLVSVNGTGPRPVGVDVDFMEGVGLLPTSTFSQARAFCRAPGRHWLFGYCWDAEGCVRMQAMLKSAALGNPNVIVSAGPDRGWPPVGR